MPMSIDLCPYTQIDIFSLALKLKNKKSQNPPTHTHIIYHVKNQIEKIPKVVVVKKINKKIKDTSLLGLYQLE